MKSIKLTKEEEQSIQIIVKNYSDIFVRIEKIEKQLTELNEHKTTLINHLEDLRQSEDKTIDAIIQKYGKGKLNLETFEYELD